MQATRPIGDFPEFRLRFTPPSGKVYAPADIAVRLGNLRPPKEVAGNIEQALAQIAKGTDPLEVMDNYVLSLNRVWRHFELPANQCFLNPAAAWPKYNLIAFGDLLAQAKDFLPRLTDLYALTGQGDRSELIRALLGPDKDVGNLPPSRLRLRRRTAEHSGQPRHGGRHGRRNDLG